MKLRPLKLDEEDNDDASCSTMSEARPPTVHYSNSS